MAQQYDDTNRGVLFKNDKNDKEGNEARPDYTGKINIDGRELRLAAWIKDGRSGKFMSINVSEFKSPQQHNQSDGFAGTGGQIVKQCTVQW